MNTIKDKVITEQIIKKSLFITHLAPVQSVDEANEYLKSIRKEHYEATHNCYSYIIGDDGYNYKYSDDGEPSQTAGIVIYDVLRKNDLTNIICIVTRYYGGIKLGAGGLVRAYSSSAASAVKEAEIVEIIKTKHFKVEVIYQYLNEVMSLLDIYENINKTFSDVVVLEYIIPETQIENLTETLINITKNNIKIEVS